MSTLTKSIEMLYCPKCKREYKDGVQRFCNNDGVRLLPALNSGAKSKINEGGVFTSLLGKKPAPSGTDEQIKRKPSRPIQKRPSEKRPAAADKRPGGNEGPSLPSGGKIFASEKVINPQVKPNEPVEKTTRQQVRKPVTDEIKRPVDRVSKGINQPPNLGKPKAADPKFVEAFDDEFELDIPLQAIETPSSDVIEDNQSDWIESVEQIEEPPVFQTSDPVVDEMIEESQPRPLDRPKASREDIVPPKTSARTVNPLEVAKGHAEVGDRSVHPAGRSAISRGQRNALLGQTVKGRYRIVKTLSEDDWSITYLAEDTILQGKGAVVRVMLQSLEQGSFEDKIFHEERVSLSHINHPNVAKVVDSGELQEGYPFIVTSDFNEDSVGQIFGADRKLNPMRIARIVQQASYALSEVHQNGILHRHLRPESILLTVSEAGVEQVKVSDFCVSDGKPRMKEFQFMAPEQLGGQLPTFASDSYSLAVIAYRLLTQRMPFFGDTPRALISDQKKGLLAKPSELNDALAPEIDEVFARALDFDPAKRFPKARDFGEALYGAISKDGTAPVVPPIADEGLVEEEDTESLAIAASVGSEDGSEMSFKSDESADKDKYRVAPKSGDVADAPWKQRSPDPVNEKSSLWLLVPLVGILLLSFIGVGVWQYFLRTKDTPQVQTQGTTTVDRKGIDDEAPSTLSAEGFENPPPSRNVVAPTEFVFFENQKLNSLSPELVKKFQPFSVYYPEDWQRKKLDNQGQAVDDMFLDVVKTSKDGIPIEQFSVTAYESKGTFKADTNIFVKLVEKSNKEASEDLKPASFRVVSQGVSTIQGKRWRAYQVNFESKGVLPNGEPLTIWVRRLWIPVQRPGAKNGFVVTMLASSLSEDVKSADEVGKKGDLRTILDTFEPGQDF